MRAALVACAFVACGHEYEVSHAREAVDTGGPAWWWHECTCGPNVWPVCMEGREQASQVAESWGDVWQCLCEPLAPACPTPPSDL